MGVSVVNAEQHLHFQPSTGLFELSIKRHQQNINVDTVSATCNEAAWAGVVASCLSTDSDSTFATVLQGAFGSTWVTNNIITPGHTAGYRTMIKKLVQPDP